METKDVINKKPEAKKEEDVNPQIIEMQQSMQEMSDRLAQATTVLADKDKEIEDMRAANVKVVDDKLAQEKDLKEKFGIKNVDKPKRSAEDINSLTNVEMFEVIADVVENSLDAHRTEAAAEMDKGFQNLDTKFDSVVSHIMKKEADVDLQRVRSENKDFDEHKDAIREVLKNHQEFTIEDAYDWVKMKEAKGQVATKHTDSEKPDKDLSAADEAVVRSKKQPEGRKISRNRQFRMSVEDALDRVQARRGGQK